VRASLGFFEDLLATVGARDAKIVFFLIVDVVFVEVVFPEIGVVLVVPFRLKADLARHRNPSLERSRKFVVRSVADSV
jgi:hypothetical protein